MPQHSFGASDRAWATISSSRAREIFMRARLAMPDSLFSVLGTENWQLLRQPCLLGLLGLLGRLVLFGLAAQRALELANSPAQRTTRLGELLGAQHDQRDGQDDDELEGSDLKGHARRLLPCVQDTTRLPLRAARY